MYGFRQAVIANIRIRRQKEENAAFETVVTDNDTKLKNNLTHTDYKLRRFNNICGMSLSHTPKSITDPAHHTKCVAGAFKNA